MKLARVVLSLLLLVACDGELGCVSCSPGLGGYPSPAPPGGALQTNVAVLQLQEQGALFVARHFVDLVRSRLPTRTVAGRERALFYPDEFSLSALPSITLRDGCIGAEAYATCTPRIDAADATLGPSYRSSIEIDLATLSDVVDVRLSPQSGSLPDTVRLIFADVDVFIDLALVLGTVDGSSTCLVRDDNDRAIAHLDELRLDVGVRVDAEGRFLAELIDVGTSVAPLSTEGLFALDLAPCNGGSCSDPTCVSAECTRCGDDDLLGQFVSLGSDVLPRVLAATVTQLFEQALGAALAEVNGTPLVVHAGVDGVHMAAEPSSDDFEVSGPIGARGLGLRLDAGLFGEENRCAPTVSPPNYELLRGPVPVFSGSLVLDDGEGASHTETYHLALAVANVTLTQAAHAAFVAGAECRFIAPRPGFAPTLALFDEVDPRLVAMGAADAALYGELHPTSAPRVRLGTGEPGSPHVSLELGDVGLSLYAVVDDALVRVATLAADVRVTLNAVQQDATTLSLGVVSVEAENAIVIEGEWSDSPGLTELFAPFLSVAVADVLAAVPGLRLDVAPLASTLLGLPLEARVQAVRREGDSEAQGYLATYLSLCTAAEMADESHRPCYRPQQVPISRSTAELAAVREGAIELRVPPSRRYRVRVDETYWSADLAPAPSGLLLVRHPLLSLRGDHHIEVVTSNAAHHAETLVLRR